MKSYFGLLLAVVFASLVVTTSIKSPFQTWVRKSNSEDNRKHNLLNFRGGEGEDEGEKEDFVDFLSVELGVKHIANAKDFEKEMEKAGNSLVVIDFSASWCMPCKMIAPVFEEMALSEEYKGIVFVKIDVDEVPEIAEKFKVMAMPTFLFLREGKVVERFSGASVEKLRETISSLI